jgi:hypothetical protein
MPTANQSLRVPALATLPSLALGTGRACVLPAVVCVLAFSTGCASSLTPPFDKMKDQPMTVYRLQNFEPPTQAAAAPGAGGLQLPAQIQQWITAGASLLPPGLLPPGLLPGTTPQAPPAPDAQRFHGFRILDYRQISDPGTKGDIVDLFGHSSNFQATASSCMYAEFGYALAQPTAPPADILVSLSCEQVQAYNFAWPYPQTGITPDSSKKLSTIAQKVFQGR